MIARDTSRALTIKGVVVYKGNKIDCHHEAMKRKLAGETDLLVWFSPGSRIGDDLGASNRDAVARDAATGSTFPF